MSWLPREHHATLFDGELSAGNPSTDNGQPKNVSGSKNQSAAAFLCGIAKHLQQLIRSVNLPQRLTLILHINRWEKLLKGTQRRLSPFCNLTSHALSPVYRSAGTQLRDRSSLRTVVGLPIRKPFFRGCHSPQGIIGYDIRHHFRPSGCFWHEGM